MERDWDCLITTYEICNLEKNALSKFAWQYLIIDEAHRLKNEASQFSQTVRMLRTAHRLLITGTPLQVCVCVGVLPPSLPSSFPPPYDVPLPSQQSS